jgi:hypothetical protein
MLYPDLVINFLIGKYYVLNASPCFYRGFLVEGEANVKRER